MKLIPLFYIILLFSLSGYSQSKIDSVLKVSNNQSVEYILHNELKITDSIVLLDTREKKEFKVSHLKNAVWVGYTNFNANKVTKTVSNKDTPIIVYCSIGVRSEDIGEKLLELGYTNVQNLYGGIFEWKNNNLPVYDNKNTITKKVHAFDQEWGKLLTKGEKVYH